MSKILLRLCKQEKIDTAIFVDLTVLKAFLTLLPLLLKKNKKKKSRC